MLIGIEAERANLPQKTGVEYYAVQLIKHLAKIDQTNQYVLYFRTKPAEWFYKLPKNFTCKVIPFPKFWTQLRISWEMIWHPVDILLIPASALPLYHPKKSVVTVHDIAFEMFPQAFTTFMRNYLKWSTRFAVKQATAIIAVSESTKRDLVKIYGADAQKIYPIYLGLDNEFKPRTYNECQPVLDQWGITYQKYILFVGTLQPRKNIIRLLDAYELLKNRNHIEEKLVIVGKKGWLWEPIMKKIQSEKLSGAVKLLDYVEDQNLPAIFAGASLLTLPALYEGFGFPPLEAMASGVPVVVSNVSSLPEVVGDAGILVDPYDTESIADGLLNALQDKNLRENLIEKGFRQAAKFTWENTAKKTLELFESLGS